MQWYLVFANDVPTLVGSITRSETQPPLVFLLLKTFCIMFHLLQYFSLELTNEKYKSSFKRCECWNIILSSSNINCQLPQPGDSTIKIPQIVDISLKLQMKANQYILSFV